MRAVYCAKLVVDLCRHEFELLDGASLEAYCLAIFEQDPASCVMP